MLPDLSVLRVRFFIPMLTFVVDASRARAGVRP
jgi:hypothetical protein